MTYTEKDALSPAKNIDLIWDALVLSRDPDPESRWIEAQGPSDHYCESPEYFDGRMDHWSFQQKANLLPDKRNFFQYTSKTLDSWEFEYDSNQSPDG